MPYPYERSENLLSALALQAAWTYHFVDMPCAAFTPYHLNILQPRIHPNCGM